MKKIGILTWHYYNNFGSALQAYAMQTVLSNLGGDVSIVNYRNPKLSDSEKKLWAKSMIATVASRIHIDRYSYPYIRFQKKYLKEGKYLVEKNELSDYCRDFDLLFFGSDQIWAPNVLNTVYMGDFIETDHPAKISYAASIGLNEIPEEKDQLYKKLLGGFKMISVREKSGSKLLSDKYGISSETVLDPTLLLNQEDYVKLEKAVSTGEGKYVFCYFLNKNNKYRKCVEDYATRNGLKIIGVSAKEDDRYWMRLFHNIGPSEFVYLLRKAAVVFTDSYHGTIFSLLFHKDFYTLKRFSEQDAINQNERIYQLNDWFGIGDRIIDAEVGIVHTSSLDYVKIDTLLASARDFSRSYIERAVSNG